MRLIDADAVKTVDYSGLVNIAPDDYRGIADYFYKQLITNQPTAYDVDKVVKDLKDHSYKSREWNPETQSFDMPVIELDL